MNISNTTTVKRLSKFQTRTTSNDMMRQSQIT